MFGINPDPSFLLLRLFFHCIHRNAFRCAYLHSVSLERTRETLFLIDPEADRDITINGRIETFGICLAFVKNDVAFFPAFLHPQEYSVPS